MSSSIDETSTTVEEQIVNVSSVPQRSPFRYPGGKTWLVPTVRKWLASLGTRPQRFVEPFAGGGIIALTVAMEDLADTVLMIERDPSVAAVWKTILSNKSEALAQRILDFDLSRERAIAALELKAKSVLDTAFQTILRNRVQRGGILAAGASLLKTGENGKGIASRWYPETLARRIRAIAEVRHRIEFVEADAFTLLPRYLGKAKTVFFVDPPYTASAKGAGSRLYQHSVIDHEKLFTLMSRAKGRVMLTYDDASEVEGMAIRHGLTVKRVLMKSTHHAKMFELVITNDSRRSKR